MRKQDTKKLISFALALSLLSGCGSFSEVTSDKSGMDMLTTNNENVDSDLTGGVVQVKDVDNEDFKLVIEYVYEEGLEWKVTDTKHLCMTIKTKGLKDGLEVYIDNVHTDTSIVSTKPLFDGILQDTMDDRIHNSLMLGFPISDTISYVGCNVIEGQNSEFLEGYTHGYNGYSSGSIETKRYLESDFLEKGVYANQIDSVIDLIIVDTNIGKTRTVSVFSNLLVEVYNKVAFIETIKDETYYVVYEYDIYGKRTEISREIINEEDNTLKLTPNK